MKTVFTLLVVLIIAIPNAVCQNKAGTLDSSFGNNGTVLTYSLYPIGFDKQMDGSIITAGNINSKDTVGYFAMKYAPDGVVDTSFGINGRAYYPDNAGYAVCMAVQPDNKILVAGYHQEMFGQPYVSIIRFNTGGTIDSSFGNNGNVIGDVGRIYALTIQPDGKILAEGLDFEQALTMRFLPDGTTDKSFGINGKVENNFGDGSIGYTIAVQPDGKIVIGGHTGTLPFLARYTANGVVDQSFGTAGNVTYNLGNTASIDDLVLQHDGKIVAVGTIASGTPNVYNSLVFRSMSDGSLDPVFGNNGYNQTHFTTSSSLKSVILQKDGKIVTCGSVYEGFYRHTTLIYTSSFLLERYTTDGFPDSSFAINGNQITSLDSTIASASIFLQGSDEKIVVGGSSENVYDQTPTGIAIVLARYNNDKATKKQIIITKIRHWINNDNIKISPNPATRNLYIEGLPSNQKIKLTVVDFSGDAFISQQLAANSSSSYNLNIASLKQGNYLLKIETNDDVVTRQFVKE